MFIHFPIACPDPFIEKGICGEVSTLPKHNRRDDAEMDWVVAAIVNGYLTDYDPTNTVIKVRLRCVLNLLTQCSFLMNL